MAGPMVVHEATLHLRPPVAHVELDLAAGRTLGDGPWRSFLRSHAPGRAGPGVVGYSIDIAAAAAAGARFEGFAALTDGFLLRPQVLFPPLPEGDVVRLAFAMPDGWSVSTGLALETQGSAQGMPRWEAATGFESPFLAFGPFGRFDVEVPGGVVEVAIDGPLPVESTQLRDWVEAAANGVARLYGGFPAPRAQLLLACGGPSPLGFGLAMGNGGWSVLAWPGRGTTAQQLRSDWILAHEMVHLGWPRLKERHAWLTEGIATYAGPWARHLGGQLGAGAAFETMTGMFAHGQAKRGHQGLDHDRDWGRTYWGGAAWCLEADMELAERSGGTVRLWDALRGLRAAGWSIARNATVREVLACMDSATGQDVLARAYARHADAAVPFDLARLEAAGRRWWTSAKLDLRDIHTT